MNILAILRTVSKSVVTSARNLIKLGVNAYAELSGDETHIKVVNALSAAFPKLPKWVCHAIVAATYGWLERNEPDSLKPVTGTLADEAIDPPAPPLVQKSVFTVVETPATPAPATPPPTAPVGESKPPPPQ